LPAITELFYGASAILFTILLASRLGIISIAIGLVIGGILRASILTYSIKQKEKTFSLSWNINHPGVKKIQKLIWPKLVAIFIPNINIMVDRLFASGLGVGCVSYLSYANRLFLLPSAILVSTLGKTFIPITSAYAASKSHDELRRFISKSVRAVGFIIIPLAIMLFILRVPLIKFLFQRGAFDTNDAYLTSTVFLFYDIGLASLCFNPILIGIFYALQDTITPLKIAINSFFLNIIFDLILMKLLGLNGIALGTSLILILNTFLLFRCLYNKIGYFEIRRIFITLSKISLAAGLMGIVVWLLSVNAGNLLSFKHQILELCTFFLIGVIIYFGTCFLLRMEEFKRVIILLKRYFWHYTLNVFP